MTNVFLGLDFGTGGSKGCIANAEGEVLAYHFEEYPIITQNPRWSEHDPEQYWKNAQTIIQRCLEQAKVSPKDIKGIAVSSALPCLVMVDSECVPIHNAYNLMDRRATDEVSRLKATLGEHRLFDLTGNRLDDHPTIINLLWEKRNRPESYRRIHKALTIEGFINAKLTGRQTLVNTNAAFYGVAYNIREDRFDKGILEEIGIAEDILPEICYPEEIIGEVTHDAARQTGLAAGTPVCGGQADFNASCLASGVIQEGDVQCNLGTCGNFGIIHKAPEFMPEMLALRFTVGARDTYITIPTTTTGGMTMRYIRDNFSHTDGHTGFSDGQDAYDILNQEAEKVSPGSDGLIVLPFLMGERTPIWDVYARGCVFGLSLNHRKGHIIKATMEGVAYAMYDSYQVVKQRGVQINPPIVMHEGGAKSPLWRQIITDVFNTPTVLTKKRVGAPFGDAVLAGVAVGLLESFGVVKQWAEYIDPMEPDQERHALYMEYFKVFKDLYHSVRDDFKTMSRLRRKTLERDKSSAPCAS